EEIGVFKPPFLIHQSLIKQEKRFCFSATPNNYFILLMEAGEAAISYSEKGKISLHKGFSRYMVRKSQGKNQLNHLKTKGKSRLGSRIRLQQSIKFFEEINQRLLDWGFNSKQDKLYFRSAQSLWPHLYLAPNAVFDKDDLRLLKLPYNIPDPSFKSLQYVN